MLSVCYTQTVSAADYVYCSGGSSCVQDITISVYSDCIISVSYSYTVICSDYGQFIISLAQTNFVIVIIYSYCIIPVYACYCIIGTVDGYSVVLVGVEGSSAMLVCSVSGGVITGGTSAAPSTEYTRFWSMYGSVSGSTVSILRAVRFDISSSATGVRTNVGVTRIIGLV